MNEKSPTELERLKRKIFITYKSRINAAERLKKKEEFIQQLNIYYSLFLIMLSIYSINSSSKDLSIVITIMSIIVFVTILYFSSQNYGERSKTLKNNYLELDNLQAELTEHNINTIKIKYNNLLNNSENHSIYDFYKSIYEISDERLNYDQKRYYDCHIRQNLLISFLLRILPFFTFLIPKCLNFFLKLGGFQ